MRGCQTATATDSWSRAGRDAKQDPDRRDAGRRHDREPTTQLSERASERAARGRAIQQMARHDDQHSRGGERDCDSTREGEDEGEAKNVAMKGDRGEKDGKPGGTRDRARSRAKSQDRMGAFRRFDDVVAVGVVVALALASYYPPAGRQLDKPQRQDGYRRSELEAPNDAVRADGTFDRDGEEPDGKDDHRVSGR